MTPQALGEKLRRERQKRHLTLEQLAARTKVAASLFRGLEAGDCARWPGGIYSRGFVRAYAAAVGMDPEHTLGLFIESYPHFAPAPEPVEEETAPAAPPQAVLERVKAVLSAIRTAALFRRA